MNQYVFVLQLVFSNSFHIRNLIPSIQMAPNLLLTRGTHALFLWTVTVFLLLRFNWPGHFISFYNWLPLGLLFLLLINHKQTFSALLLDIISRFHLPNNITLHYLVSLQYVISVPYSYVWIVTSFWILVYAREWTVNCCGFGLRWSQSSLKLIYMINLEGRSWLMSLTNFWTDFV